MSFYMNCSLDEAIGYYEREQEGTECDWCGKVINDYGYRIDGDLLCPECYHEYSYQFREYMEE